MNQATKSLNGFNRLLFVLIILIFFGTIAHAQTTIFSDNFNDGSIADWDINAGTWSAVTLDLNGGGFDGSGISHDVNMSGFLNYTISYRQRPIGAGTTGSFFFFTDQNGIGNINGYELILQDATSRLRRRDNNIITNLIIGPAVSLGVYHDVNIDINGSTISVKIDGNTIGTVTDTTYVDGSQIILATENNDQNHTWDDIYIKGLGGSAATVTILRPIDERTLLSINEPWNVTMSGTAFGFTDNNANQKQFVVPKIDNQVVNFLVDDSNTIDVEYFPRMYSLEIEPNDANSYTIQPYLIAVNDGVLVSFRIVDIPTNITVPGIRTILRTGVSNQSTVVENRITDATGTSTMAMISQKQYDLNVTSISEDINYFSGAIVAPVSCSFSVCSVSVLINFTTNDSNFVPKNIQYSFAPTTENVSGVSQKFDVNVGADFNVVRFIVQAIDNNVVLSSNTSTSNPFNTSLTMNLADFNSGQVIIRTIIVGVDQNTIINKTYVISSIGTGGILNLANLRQNHSTNSILLFMVIGLFGLVSVLGTGLGGSNESQVFVGAIGIGIMSYLFLPGFFNYVIGAMFAGAIAWMWTRNSR